MSDADWKQSLLSRAQGRAAEAAEDAGEAIREGQLNAGHELLREANAHLDRAFRLRDEIEAGSSR